MGDYRKHLPRLISFLGPVLGLVAVSVFFAMTLGIQDVRERTKENEEKRRKETTIADIPVGFFSTFKSMELTSEKDFPGFRSFVSGRNFKIVLTQTVIVAICALGMTMIIVGGGIDLSLGSSVALASVVGAKLIAKGVSPVWVVPLTILSSGLIGTINGGVIAGFRMMPFIVTLGMMGVARGTAKWLAGNQTVNYPDSSSINRFMAQESPDQMFPLPWGVWLTLALSVLVTLWMQRTIFGRYIFAMGANETATVYSGIRVLRHKAATYVLAGLLFGVAGLMQLSRLTQGDPSVALGLELDVIAAVVIGGASLNGGSGSIVGSLIGSLTMAVLRNGSSQSGWPNYMQEIIIGMVIVAAVGLDKFRQRKARG